MRKAKGPWARYVELLLAQKFDGNQSALARAVGVTPQTVSRWVGNSESVPRHPVLVEFARVTERPVTEVIAVAYGVDPEDAKLKAQVEQLARKVPATELDRILDDLEEARKTKRITAAEYRAARTAITFAADAAYRKVLETALVKEKKEGELPDVAAAMS